MKNFIFTLALLFSAVVVAQENKIEPQYEVLENNVIKATYFHDNGIIAQTGFYLNGKVHGEWKAFNKEGDKIAMGEYQQGEKTGKWLFWCGEELKEVNYLDSRVASVTTWDNANSIVIRD
ncbi:toxin-antitoxin system YwqK family antitoxin [Robertkochia aurantiaca]|uniref:toxin-antitoxin system YwqK family antitoxin n=1 Tax=Robertkochia aurantiaca TaxID=2873700 RepID=UPI001CCEC60F|nr:nicotinic acid mononucleotide adenyltransferase [Robertkochia sp. 3YJGBD-33]